MKSVNFNKYLIAVFFLMSLITCKNSSVNEFDQFIEHQYNACQDTTCVVDLSNLPFKWDKFYIFSENHFPEVSTKEEISSVLGTEYNKNIHINDRLMVFLFKGKVVYEILVNYKKEDLIDPEPLRIDFYLDNKTPLFFESNNAEFIIEKTRGNYVLFWNSK